jgi:hypothetical protein
MFVSSIFTIKLYVSGIVRNFINNVHLFVIVPYFPFNLLARVSAKNCLRIHFGLSSRPHLWTIIKQLSDWCMPKASENVSVYRVSERRCCPNSSLRVGRIPSHDKHCHKIYNNNLGVCTLPMNQYSVHKANFLLLEVVNLYFTFRM